MQFICFIFLIFVLSQCTPKEKLSQPINAEEFAMPVPYASTFDPHIRDTILKYYTLGDWSRRKKIFSNLVGNRKYWFGDKHGNVGRVNGYRDDTEIFRDSIARLILSDKVNDMYCDPRYRGGSFLYVSRDLALTQSVVAKEFFHGFMQDTSYVIWKSNFSVYEPACWIYQGGYPYVTIPKRMNQLAFDALLITNGITPDDYYKVFFEEETWEFSYCPLANQEDLWRSTNLRIDSIRSVLMKIPVKSEKLE